MEQPQAYTFLTGKKSLKSDPSWWRSHLGAYLYIYCLQGEAQLRLLSRRYAIQKGGIAILSPDMFASQVGASDDFCVFYCVFDAGLADKSTFGVPKEFFDCMYTEPVLPVLEGVEAWMQLFAQVGHDAANPYRQGIVADLLHAFSLQYYHQWRRHFGDTHRHYERSNTDRLCVSFYNLMLEHYRHHRDIAYYAARLCITPNYLAMLLRRQCGESPKEAIDRQLMLDLQYQLLHTDLSVTQLARLYHFPDTSYLCRYFRRHAGMSLTEYRLRGMN